MGRFRLSLTLAAGWQCPPSRIILKPDNALTQHPDRFVDRHIGPRPDDIAAMLAALGHESLEAMINAGTPSSIRLAQL